MQIGGNHPVVRVENSGDLFGGSTGFGKVCHQCFSTLPRSAFRPFGH